MGRDAEARGRLEAARSAFAAEGRTDDVTECDHDLAIIERGRPVSAQTVAGGMALSPG